MAADASADEGAQGDNTAREPPLVAVYNIARELPLVAVSAAEELLLSNAVEATTMSDAVPRPSTQDRTRRQQEKMRKKLVTDATKIMAKLQSPRIAPREPAPDILERFKAGQRTCLEQGHLATSGISSLDAAQFMDSVMQAVGTVRTRNKRLLKLAQAMNTRAEKALENCLFKLVTCDVTVQPAPTPGWRWVKGVKGDDEYHAFKRIGAENIYYALTICYEPGRVGQEDCIFQLVVVKLAHARVSRYDMLHWNKQLQLLDITIGRVEELEAAAGASLPGNLVANTTFSLEDSSQTLPSAEAAPTEATSAAPIVQIKGPGRSDIRLPDGSPLPKKLEAITSSNWMLDADAIWQPMRVQVSIASLMRGDREALLDTMLHACERVATLESEGRPYQEHNIAISLCKMRLSELIREFDNFRKAGRDGIVLDLGDGRWSRLGVPAGGWDQPVEMS